MTDKEQIIIDGVDVGRCERHCSDNYSTPNMCYSDITRGYRQCNPKENQCDFYITSIEEQLARKTQELNVICKTFNIMYSYDEETGNIYGRCDDLYKKTQECEELKKQLETVEKWRIKAEGLNENFELKNTCYRKALEEIGEYCKRYPTNSIGFKQAILDIINKTKGEE